MKGGLVGRARPYRLCLAEFPLSVKVQKAYAR